MQSFLLLGGTADLGLGELLEQGLGRPRVPVRGQHVLLGASLDGERIGVFGQERRLFQLLI